MNTLSRALLLVMVAVAAGSPLQAQSKAKKDRSLITTEEIETANTTNVYDLIQQLRPHWLRPRGHNSLRTQTVTVADETMEVLTPSEIVVYLDGNRFGNQDVLRDISVVGVLSLQFLDASSATQRWGLGHTRGAILVTTQGRGGRSH